MPTKRLPLIHTDEHYGPVDPGCEICRNNLPFEFPSQLIDAVIAKRVVLFAGAGISTESRYVTNLTMYEDLASDIGLLKQHPPFPTVVSRFVEKYGRTELVEYILTRFEKTAAFPAQDRLASRFHREMAVIPQLTEIVTTNWDDYFERFTFAIPFVTDADFAYWHLKARKVFKIHGSAQNVGTIIATEEDYARRLAELERGVMGASLKLALATKTLVFVGYSFRDDDFNQIQRYLSSQMGDLLPRSYAITLSDEKLPPLPQGHIVRTDAAFFFYRLKQELAQRGVIPTDERVLAMVRYRDALDAAHAWALKLGQHRFPPIVYSTCFQEGAMHALDRATRRWPSGEYHDWSWLEQQIHSYGHLIRGANKVSRYEDAAYLEGYVVGLLTIRGDTKKLGAPPLFFLPGVGYVRTRKDIRSLVPQAGRHHKAATRRIEAFMAKLPPQNTFAHTTDLLGVRPA